MIPALPGRERGPDCPTPEVGRVGAPWARVTPTTGVVDLRSCVDRRPGLGVEPSAVTPVRWARPAHRLCESVDGGTTAHPGDPARATRLFCQTSPALPNPAEAGATRSRARNPDEPTSGRTRRILGRCGHLRRHHGAAPGGHGLRLEPDPVRGQGLRRAPARVSRDDARRAGRLGRACTATRQHRAAALGRLRAHHGAVPDRRHRQHAQPLRHRRPGGTTRTTSSTGCCCAAASGFCCCARTSRLSGRSRWSSRASARCWRSAGSSASGTRSSATVRSSTPRTPTPSATSRSAVSAASSPPSPSASRPVAPRRGRLRDRPRPGADTGP